MSKRLSTYLLAIFVLILNALLLLACADTEKEETKIDRKELEESLIKANRHLVQKESEEIDDFLKKHNWEMQQSGSGLRYMIYERGEGRAAKKGDRVKFTYSLSLLSGDTVESSQDGNYLTFRIGKENEIAGLHEAALLLREGDRARFIIPPHLAYGLTGLPNKIPARSTLIYDVKLIEIK